MDFNTAAFYLQGAGTVEQLSQVSGIGEAALRLLIGLLLGYPLAFIYRFILPQHAYLVKHLFSFLSGIWLAFFCYRMDFLHSFLSIIITYLVLRLSPNRTIGLIIAFIGNASHLLFSYYNNATDDYDLDFTTAQSVLTLRLIGFAWDYFDGGRDEKLLEHDQKLNGLKQLPSLLETLSYCYFFVGFLIGPQFPFRQYREFYQMKLFRKGDQISIPSCVLPTLRCFFLGVLYLGFNNILVAYFPSSYLSTKEYLEEISFVERLIYVWIICKVALARYLGVWLIGEGPTVISGMNFRGWDAEGKAKGWDALSNVKPWLYETSLNLQGLVEAFNINTNDWIKRYVFKRLKFLNNRNISGIVALIFLAIWHGLYSGYFFCFLLEWVDMEGEKTVRRLAAPLWNVAQKSAILTLLYNITCYIVRSFALHYGLAPFELKTWGNSIRFYNSLYWIGHIIVAVIIILGMIFPQRKAKTEGQATTKKEL